MSEQWATHDWHLVVRRYRHDAVSLAFALFLPAALGLAYLTAHGLHCLADAPT
jgi:hypothetical protein